ncbi:alpha/beta hydrolase [Pseudomonas sp. sp1636]|uniref:dienelactone hydrolase family protein n=1 Tax=Pseudomonas sp. sp1636 TaxID=3036707 RepID=UPI0025A60F52|nr:alpha/beta family hydrolase [Pseudomonas sp. sp1636]MDM8350250.1 alpha/beta hydrolase [Pseudomonas sp. sp1636]
MQTPGTRVLNLTLSDVQLAADLLLPAAATGLVVFVHGSGSSRLSPRNQQVARYFNGRGLATLLFDLLSEVEQRLDRVSRELRFDIPLLTGRLLGVIDWLGADSQLRHLRLGLFGASTGAAAALLAAAQRTQRVQAVVSRGGRSDLAGSMLAEVLAPTLLIVGGEDSLVLQLNRQTGEQLRCIQRLAVIPGASHLFEEPGALEIVAREAGDWFERYLGTATR